MVVFSTCYKTMCTNYNFIVLFVGKPKDPSFFPATKFANWFCMFPLKSLCSVIAPIKARFRRFIKYDVSELKSSWS